MKKKIPVIALLAVASSVLAFAVGCGGDSHQHSYKMKSDSESHWQECECGDKKSSFSHVDELINGTNEAGSDGKCDVCGANVEIPHDHVYSILNSDDDGHWYECECGKQDPAKAPESHVDLKNNETEEDGADGKCDVCGANVEIPHDHVYSILQSDPDEHWYECECGKKDPAKAPESHVDLKNNETEEDGADGKCDVCGAAVHLHAYTLKSGLAQHWQECGCGNKKDFADHVDEIDNDSKEAGEDNLCDVCGAVMHEHDYTEPKFDDDEHWNECACGAKDAAEAHVDEINNETKAEEKDGKCDVCGYQFKETVTFDMGGIGETPKAQKVLYGEYAVAPQNPVAPKGCVFEGWYADANCKTPFDFETTQITEDTVIYAKWTVTPGSSKESAIAFIKNSEEGVAAFGELDELYLKYTATAQSRMNLELISFGASAKCTFTTYLDDNQTVYHSGEGLKFDLEKNETIYVIVLRGSDVANNQTVGLYLTDVVSEPFPEEGWRTGEYSNGSVTLKFDKEKKTASYNDGAASSVVYIGGTHAHATFTANDTVYTLTQTKQDELRLTATTSNGNLDLTLKRVFPVDISMFRGIYRLSGASSTVISEFGIYESGNGYYILGNKTYKQMLGNSGNSFNQSNNTLTYSGKYSITLNLDDDDNPVSISVIDTSSTNNPSKEYQRVSDIGDEVPETLPLPTNIELAGETLSIICQNGQQKWQDGNTVAITKYVKATDVYTVQRNTTVYTLEIEGEGDDVVVKIFDTTHNNLLDTLSKKTVELKALKLDGTDNEIEKSDVKGNFAVFSVPASGTFLFNVTAMKPDFSYDIYVYVDYENSPGSFVNLRTYNSNTKMILREGNQFAINLVEYGSKFESMTFTLTEEVADPGTTPESAFQLSVGEETSVSALCSDTTNDFYATFTAEEAGEYHICCYGVEWGQTNYKISFTVDGVQNGYAPVSYYFGYYYRDGVQLANGETDYKEAPYATVHLEAGQTVTVVLNRKNQAGGSFTKVAVTVEKAD